MSRLGALLRRPFQVQLPWLPVADGGRTVEVPVGVLRRPAALVAWLVPIVMMVVGLVVAVLAAVAAERERTEGIGTLGTELGAALWFAGAVVWGARRRATVARAALLALVLVLGLVLIGMALVRGWSGAGLSLAMEFGVGMVAVAVLDVVLIGILDQLRSFARRPDGEVVVLRLGRARPLEDGEDLPRSFPPGAVEQ